MELIVAKFEKSINWHRRGELVLTFEPAEEGVVLRVGLVEGARDVAFEETLPELEAGAVLYLRVVQRDQGAAWSSPFFVEAPAEAR